MRLCIIIILFLFLIGLFAWLFWWSSLWKVIKNLFFSLYNITEQIFWITIIHLILMKCCYFYFVRILSIFLESSIFFLLQFNSYRLWMSKRLCVKFIIIIFPFWSWTLILKIISKMKTIFMTSCLLSRTICLFSFIMLLFIISS